MKTFVLSFLVSKNMMCANGYPAPTFLLQSFCFLIFPQEAIRVCAVFRKQPFIRSCFVDGSQGQYHPPPTFFGFFLQVGKHKHQTPCPKSSSQAGAEPRIEPRCPESWHIFLGTGTCCLSPRLHDKVRKPKPYSLY